MQNIEIETYLPNLYLKKFRLIERLNNIRYGFPAVQNIQNNANQLQQRRLNAWDFVLRDVNAKVHFMNQKKKYKIAVNAFIAKKCQKKVKRKQLKKQQLTLFHRVISSHLSEKVLKRFEDIQTQKDNQVVDQPNTEPIKIQKPTYKGNDVFYEDQNQMQEMHYQNNNSLFDQFFQEQPVIQNNQEIIKQEVPDKIDTYMVRIKNQLGLGQPIKIKRRQCLKRIKENLKKRHKYKEKTNLNTNKIGGAELILSNLINFEVQDQGQSMPTLNKNISNASVNQQFKKRRKKEELFNLMWSQETYEQMKALNGSIDRKQLKFENINDLLTLYVIKDPKSQQYGKVFEKTIEHEKDFPKKLQQIQIPSPEQDQKYIQTFYDKEYQEFIIKNECQIDDLIKHFIEVSCYLFPEQLDLSSKNHCIELQARKLFTAGSITNSKSKMIKYQKQMVVIMDEQFMKENVVLKKLVICAEIYFLIEYYLSKFGNKWDIITQCIRLNPISKSMMLNKTQIQNLHSYYNMKREKNITFPQKLVLPYQNEFEKETKPKSILNQPEDSTEIDLDKYEEFLKTACNSEGNSQQIMTEFDYKFNNFKRSLVQVELKTEQNTFIDVVRNKYNSKIGNTLEEFKCVLEVNSKKYNQKKVDKVITPIDAKANFCKNPKMNATVLKRRKVITEKTSNLVNIFQKIRRPPTFQPPLSMPSTYPQLKKTESLSAVTTTVTPPTPANGAQKIQNKPIQKKATQVVKQEIKDVKPKIQDQAPQKKPDKPEKPDINKSNQKKKDPKEPKDKK